MANWLALIERVYERGDTDTELALRRQAAAHGHHRALLSIARILATTGRREAAVEAALQALNTDDLDALPILAALHHPADEAAAQLVTQQGIDDHGIPIGL